QGRLQVGIENPQRRAGPRYEACPIRIEISLAEIPIPEERRAPGYTVPIHVGGLVSPPDRRETPPSALDYRLRIAGQIVSGVQPRNDSVPRGDIDPRVRLGGVNAGELPRRLVLRWDEVAIEREPHAQIECQTPGRCLPLILEKHAIVGIVVARVGREVVNRDFEGYSVPENLQVVPALDVFWIDHLSVGPLEIPPQLQAVVPPKTFIGRPTQRRLGALPVPVVVVR